MREKVGWEGLGFEDWRINKSNKDAYFDSLSSPPVGCPFSCLGFVCWKTRVSVLLKRVPSLHCSTIAVVWSCNTEQTYCAEHMDLPSGETRLFNLILYSCTHRHNVPEACLCSDRIWSAKDKAVAASDNKPSSSADPVWWFVWFRKLTLSHKPMFLVCLLPCCLSSPITYYWWCIIETCKLLKCNQGLF